MTSNTASGPESTRLIEKCVSIYRRKRSLKAVSKFAERVITNRSDEVNFLEDCVRPAVREEFYPGLTISSFLDEALEIYRNGKSRTLALVAIWEKIDWVLPFTSDEYEEFVKRLEPALAKGPNPPTQEDWDYLNDWLMK